MTDFVVEPWLQSHFADELENTVGIAQGDPGRNLLVEQRMVRDCTRTEVLCCSKVSTLDLGSSMWQQKSDLQMIC